MSTHTVEEMQELLVTGTEFPDLVMVKIKAEQLIPSLDNLIARINK